MATGAQILELAEKHVGESYILGAIAPKTNPNWHGPWDCAEYISWCVFRVAGILRGCNHNSRPANADAYTGFWARDVDDGVVQRISVDRASRTPGAILLRKARRDRIGHIVFSVGTGATLEAHSRRLGVIRGTLSGRRWDTGILIPDVDYTTGGAVAVSDPPKIFRLASPHMKGPVVRRIQVALKEKGFDPGDADGDFGHMTQAAVFAFQLAEGLVPDGEVGPETAGALGISLA